MLCFCTELDRVAGAPCTRCYIQLQRELATVLRQVAAAERQRASGRLLGGVTA